MGRRRREPLLLPRAPDVRPELPPGYYGSMAAGSIVGATRPRRVPLPPASHAGPPEKSGAAALSPPPLAPPPSSSSSSSSSRRRNRAAAEHAGRADASLRPCRAQRILPFASAARAHSAELRALARSAADAELKQREASERLCTLAAQVAAAKEVLAAATDPPIHADPLASLAAQIRADAERRGAAEVDAEQADGNQTASALVEERASRDVDGDGEAGGASTLACDAGSEGHNSLDGVATQPVVLEAAQDALARDKGHQPARTNFDALPTLEPDDAADATANGAPGDGAGTVAAAAAAGGSTGGGGSGSETSDTGDGAVWRDVWLSLTLNTLTIHTSPSKVERLGILTLRHVRTIEEYTEASAPGGEPLSNERDSAVAGGAAPAASYMEGSVAPEKNDDSSGVDAAVGVALAPGAETVEPDPGDVMYGLRLELVNWMEPGKLPPRIALDLPPDDVIDVTPACHATALVAPPASLEPSPPARATGPDDVGADSAYSDEPTSPPLTRDALALLGAEAVLPLDQLAVAQLASDPVPAEATGAAASVEGPCPSADQVATAGGTPPTPEVPLLPTFGDGPLREGPRSTVRLLFSTRELQRQWLDTLRHALFLSQYEGAAAPRLTAETSAASPPAEDEGDGALPTRPLNPLAVCFSPVTSCETGSAPNAVFAAKAHPSMGRAKAPREPHRGSVPTGGLEAEVIARARTAPTSQLPTQLLADSACAQGQLRGSEFTSRHASMSGFPYGGQSLAYGLLEEDRLQCPAANPPAAAISPGTWSPAATSYGMAEEHRLPYLAAGAPAAAWAPAATLYSVAEEPRLLYPAAAPSAASISSSTWSSAATVHSMTDERRLHYPAAGPPAAAISSAAWAPAATHYGRAEEHRHHCPTAGPPAAVISSNSWTPAATSFSITEERQLQCLNAAPPAMAMSSTWAPTATSYNMAEERRLQCPTSAPSATSMAPSSSWASGSANQHYASTDFGAQQSHFGAHDQSRRKDWSPAGSTCRGRSPPPPPNDYDHQMLLENARRTAVTPVADHDVAFWQQTTRTRATVFAEPPPAASINLEAGFFSKQGSIARSTSLPDALHSSHYWPLSSSQDTHIYAQSHDASLYPPSCFSRTRDSTPSSSFADSALGSSLSASHQDVGTASGVGARSAPDTPLYQAPRAATLSDRFLAPPAAATQARYSATSVVALPAPFSAPSLAREAMATGRTDAEAMYARHNGARQGMSSERPSREYEPHDFAPSNTECNEPPPHESDEASATPQPSGFGSGDEDENEVGRMLAQAAASSVMWDEEGND